MNTPTRHIMRALTVFIALLTFQLPMQASHYSAGEIFYEWIGDEPGKDSLDYRVYATIYRNVNGVTIGPGNLSGCAYRKSNGASVSITLNYQSPNSQLSPNYTRSSSDPYGWENTGPHPVDSDGWAIPNASVCAKGNKNISEYRYVGEVTLTGSYRDWHFAIFPPCCRDQNDNLSGGGNLYLEVDLDNFSGPNSSPVFLAQAVTNLCVKNQSANSKPFYVDLRTGEEDNDSIVYRFDPDGSQAGNSCNSGSPIPYSGSLSSNNPMPSSPPARFDQNSQGLFISPTQAGDYVLKFEAVEYRYDTTSRNWQIVGNTIRELQVGVTASCDTSRINWSLKDNITNNLSADCGDSTLSFAVSKPLIPSSLASDGSDFSLKKSNGDLVPIIGANYNQNNQKIRIQLRDTVDFNDTLDLFTRIGSDTNTLVSICSYELPEFDTVTVITSGCTIDTSSGTGLHENSLKHFRIFPNPASDFVTIESVQEGKPLEVKLYNLTGKVILQKLLPAHARRINMENIPSGTYILDIRQGALREQRKLLVSDKK